MANKKFSYKVAMAELEDIVGKIEQDELDLDELSASVKRATELIVSCKKKLKETDEELSDTLRGLEESS